MWKLIGVLFVIAVYESSSTNPEIEEEELQARAYLEFLNKRTAENENKVAQAEWDYASNITESNLKKNLAIQKEVANQVKEYWNEVIKFNWETFSNYDLKRQFKKYSKLGIAALPDDRLMKFNKLVADMQKIYSTAKLCDYADKEKCDLSLEPDLTNILRQSRDAEELKHVWVEWRNSVGAPCRHLFKEYVDLLNDAAHMNNYTDASEAWLESYEDPDIKQQIESLWEQIRPLYLQIHAYVRFHLRKKYGDIVSERGPIPAHLLGNMWSQTWGNIAELALPYPDKKDENLNDQLKKQNYTAIRIFKTAEDFFKSINLTELPTTFWEKSILEKPKDREIICHASAWDFYDGKDFRIKQCTDVTMQHFFTAHHEMGHIEYYLQYKDLPIQFRRGANNGFHEAVGDLIALSVQSRKHLRKIGLLKSESDDSEAVLNALFRIGLDKIVFLPFAYVVDLWRWNVFSENITVDDYNCKWWELREKYQGIEPPINRTEHDFDPAAKYHIIADVPYIRYFVSFIIQFQFHKAVCEEAGQYSMDDPSKPLYECDIYGSEKAGNALKKMLQMGAKRPWQDIFEQLIGQRTMDASSLLEYFKPLKRWLQQQNRKNGVFIGWEKSKTGCHKSNNENKSE